MHAADMAWPYCPFVAIYVCVVGTHVEYVAGGRRGSARRPLKWKLVLGLTSPVMGTLTVKFAALAACLSVADSQSGICSNACAFAYDEACDDGGPGAEYVSCAPGTDCADCGDSSSQSGMEETGSSTPFIISGVVVLIGLIAALVAIIVCAVRSSLQCYAIFVLVVSIITLIVGLLSVLTIVGIPFFIATVVSSLLAIPASSILACGCCNGPDGRPGGLCAAGTLCVISFVIRVVALILSIFFLFTSVLTILWMSYFGLILAGLSIVLTAASGISELILAIKCLQCCTQYQSQQVQGGVQLQQGGVQLVQLASAVPADGAMPMPVAVPVAAAVPVALPVAAEVQSEPV